MQIVGYDAADGGLLLSPDSDGDAAGGGTATNAATDADDTTTDAVADANKEISYRSLEPGTELEYTLGERHCAGTIHDDRHIACSNPTAPYCPDHDSTWVCARCTGTCLKDEMDCYDDHAVYLAAFAPATFKVGVTKEWRLATRLREQGADRAAHIATVANGRIAREREAEIAAEVPDRVRVPTKQAGLGRSVDTDAWESLLADFDPIERYDLDYGLGLDSQPVAETVAAGTVRGTKGRLLLLDREGSAYAVDMRGLVGYDVTEERSSRELQSSLGSFE